MLLIWQIDKCSSIPLCLHLLLSQDVRLNESLVLSNAQSFPPLERFFFPRKRKEKVLKLSVDQRPAVFVSLWLFVLQSILGRLLRTCRMSLLNWLLEFIKKRWWIEIDGMIKYWRKWGADNASCTCCVAHFWRKGVHFKSGLTAVQLAWTTQAHLPNRAQ